MRPPRFRPWQVDGMPCRAILLPTCSLRQSAAANAQPEFPLRARLRQRLDLDCNDMLGIDHDRILAPLSSPAALFIGHLAMSVCRSPLRSPGASYCPRKILPDWGGMESASGCWVAASGGVAVNRPGVHQLESVRAG